MRIAVLIVCFVAMSLTYSEEIWIQDKFKDSTIATVPDVPVKHVVLLDKGKESGKYFILSSEGDVVVSIAGTDETGKIQLISKKYGKKQVSSLQVYYAQSPDAVALTKYIRIFKGITELIVSGEFVETKPTQQALEKTLNSNMKDELRPLRNQVTVLLNKSLGNEARKLTVPDTEFFKELVSQLEAIVTE